MVVLFVALVSIEGMHWSGTKLFDLECQGSNFLKEAESWAVTTSQLYDKTNKTTQCTSDMILGGPSLWSTVYPLSGWWKQYSNLPSHQGVTLQIKIYPVDGWSNDHFSIQIDSLSQDYWTLNQQTNPSAVGNLCGPTTLDIAPLTAYRTVAHTSTRLTLYIFGWISSPSDVASIGIREIVLTFFNSSTTPATSTCGVAPYDLGSDSCLCEPPLTATSGKSGYCSTCDASCLLCNKPGESGCIACRPGDYLTATGSCSKCLSSCATCSGDPDYCITCQDGSEPVNAICPLDCPSPLKVIQNECQTGCSPDEYPYWNGGCLKDCVTPLKVQTVASYPVCTFPCESSSMFLYWDGTCGNTCPPPFEKSTFANRNFCNFPCPGNELFTYWNGTCSNTCPLPLVAKKLGDQQICTYPCESESDYLYLDGSCQKECPSTPSYFSQITADFKKFCLLVCSNREYLDSDRKTCKKIELPGQLELTVTINGQLTKLSLIERVLHADNQVFTLFSEDYTLNPTWTFFGLDPSEKYALDNWQATAKCGCFKQVCGKDCQQGAGCFVHNGTAPWICHPWAERNNYCWNVKSSGKKLFTAYSLKQIATIALTSYGGLDNNNLYPTPGYTISNVMPNLENNNYALNALIIKTTPRDDLVDFEASYRYAESEGRLIRTSELASLNAPPEVQADLSLASCNLSTVNLPLTLQTKNNLSPIPFHTYLILRKAERPLVKDLLGSSILTPHGILGWQNQESFDFLDPCNQQFLTLQKDQSAGNFFVILPESQTLANSEGVICIALQDDPSSQYDLVLYELKNFTSVWSASDRFTGLLSKDYVQDLTLRITTDAIPTVTLPPNKIDIKFHLDIDPVSFSITTSVETTCQVYLSPRCILEISTSNYYRSATKSLQNCGYLNEKAVYNCQGVIGHFFPPPNLVKTKISGYVGVTTIQRVSSESFAASQPIWNNEDVLGFLYGWVIDWTWENSFSKLFTLFTLTLPIFLVILAKKIIAKPQPTNVGKQKVRYGPV